MKIKIGRNEPCPCGSGKKYKKCHGSSGALQGMLEHVFSQMNNERLKQEITRAKYGEIREQITADFEGYKFVAVGNQLHYAKDSEWKTFHDFLFDYIKKCLGADWGNSELYKNYEDRHPILQWYEDLCDFQRSNVTENQGIHSAIPSGSVGAYLALSYDLYILRHHSALQERLINRIKDKKQFQGARYEVYVVASFIKAGFDIDFEDESDRSTSHCEFVATHKKSNLKFSVEAKSRHREGLLGQDGKQRPFKDLKLRIGRLLREALKKEALYPRIVFLDVNMPPEKGDIANRTWFSKLAKEVSKVADEEIDEKPMSAAYLFFTNHPNHYVGNEEPVPNRDLILAAINIPEFKENNVKNARIRHQEIFSLWDSIRVHHNVPDGFNDL